MSNIRKKFRPFADLFSCAKAVWHMSRDTRYHDNARHHVALHVTWLSNIAEGAGTHQHTYHRPMASRHVTQSTNHVAASPLTWRPNIKIATYTHIRHCDEHNGTI